MKKRLLNLGLLLLSFCLLVSCGTAGSVEAPETTVGEDPQLVLMQSADGDVTFTLAMAKVITWLQSFDDFRESYTNYRLYQFYKEVYGDEIDLSGVVPAEELLWVENNLSILQERSGITFYDYTQIDDETITESDVSDSAVLFAVYLAAGIESDLSTALSSSFRMIKRYVALAGAARQDGLTLDEQDYANIDETIDMIKTLSDLLAYPGSFEEFLEDFMGKDVRESDVRKVYELLNLILKYTEEVTFEDESQLARLEENVVIDEEAMTRLGMVESEDDSFKVTLPTSDPTYEEKLKKLDACAYQAWQKKAKVELDEDPVELIAPIADGLYNETEQTTELVKLNLTYHDKYGAEHTGDIVIELRPDCAPITVANFQKLVAEGYYDGTDIFRIVKGFMIQGGDNAEKDADYIKGEFSANGVLNPLPHIRGTISMARRSIEYDGVSAYDSASSGFFIVQETSESNSYSLDGQYAAFGSVVYGIENVDYIAGTELVDSAAYNKAKVQPKYPAIINSATFVVPAE